MRDPITHDMLVPSGVIGPQAPAPCAFCGAMPVIIEGLPAAHVLCICVCRGAITAGVVHPPIPGPQPPIVVGSLTVMIHGMPAARCDAGHGRGRLRPVLGRPQADAHANGTHWRLRPSLRSVPRLAVRAGSSLRGARVPRGRARRHRHPVTPNRAYDRASRARRTSALANSISTKTRKSPSAIIWKYSMAEEAGMASVPNRSAVIILNP